MYASTSECLSQPLLQHQQRWSEAEPKPCRACSHPLSPSSGVLASENTTWNNPITKYLLLIVSRTYTIDHIAYLKLPLAKSNIIYAAFRFFFFLCFCNTQTRMMNDWSTSKKATKKAAFVIKKIVFRLTSCLRQMEAERSQLNCDHTDVWECCKGILKSSVQR